MVAVSLPFNCSDAGGKESPRIWLLPSRETTQYYSFSYNPQWLIGPPAPLPPRNFLSSQGPPQRIKQWCRDSIITSQLVNNPFARKCIIFKLDCESMCYMMFENTDITTIKGMMFVVVSREQMRNGWRASKGQCLTMCPLSVCSFLIIGDSQDIIQGLWLRGAASILSSKSRWFHSPDLHVKVSWARC